MNGARLANLTKPVRRAVCACWIVAFLLSARPATVQAQFNYAVLHYFNGSTNDGGGPEAGLLVYGNRFYGTTWSGGSNGFGTVFGLNTDGSGYAAIHGFSYNEGYWPQGRLVVCGSMLYGTTPRRAISYVSKLFKLNADGSAFTVVRDFTNAADGMGVYGTLAVSGTTLFGTARVGGNANHGTAFKVNSDGSGFAVLKNFDGSDGAQPYGGLVVSGTTLYGTASSGGTSNCGTIFKLNMDGSDYTVLKNFESADGHEPVATLTMSGDVLYGTTAGGGAYDSGTVFRINADGAGFAVLKHFGGSDGASPCGDLVLVGADLYGTTFSGGAYNLGTVFQVSTNGTGFVVIKHFSGTDGANPYGGLALSGSVLYGTTHSGGPLSNGVAFSLTLPVPAVVNPPTTQTAEAGTRMQVAVEVSGSPPLAYQWWFNGTALISGTNSTLEFPSVTLADAGTYAVVVTNIYGAVTSPPALLSVIAPVERRIVPALTLVGQPGSILNLDFATALGPIPLWTTFDHVPLVAASRWYFDLNSPPSPQRFYRAWQYTPGTPPVLDVHFVPSLTLTGAIGSSQRVDYINQSGPIDAWVTLATVTLTNTSQLYFDTSAIGQPARLYRIVPLP